MGKIESGEIGEVDPLPDSGSSLALIRYARRAVSSRSPPHTERGGSLSEETEEPICSSVVQLPLGIHKVFQETLSRFVFHALFVCCIPFLLCPVATGERESKRQCPLGTA